MSEENTLKLEEEDEITMQVDEENEIQISETQQFVSSGDMLKSVYDINDSGVVDNSEKLEGNTLQQIKDNITQSIDEYVHPDTHPASMIDESTARRFVSDAEKVIWNNKWEYDEGQIKAVKVNAAINADTVNGLTVETAVPLGALFTDTVYVHPATHPASMIVETTEQQFVSQLEKDGWNQALEGADGLSAYEIAVENGFVGTETEWLDSLQGEVGPQGIQGEAGPIGPKGEQGIQGIQGETGPIGPEGPKGDTGDIGPIGPEGEQGIQGIQGETGPTGPKGDTGDIGPVGPQGTEGLTAYEVAVSQGFVGTEAEWLDSLEGPQGEQGIQGPVGETGPQGIQGEIGPEGPEGSDGLTAYEVAVNEGFVGTEAEWLDSLEGPIGPQGIQGEAGPQGERGIQGEAGPKGDTGETGPTGPKGDTGDIGPVGPQGEQGETGPIGSDGLTAYEVAVANGFVGTELEWLESLKGEDGTGGAGVEVSSFLPTADDDIDKGFSVGSEWLFEDYQDELNYHLKLYKCISNRAGEAVWELIVEKEVEEISSGPGSPLLVQGDTTAGWFGEVTTAEFGADHAQIASLIGLSAGTLQNQYEPFLKFTHGGKIKFIPKKSVRNDASWDAINIALGGSVEGAPAEKIITVGDFQYKVRFMRGVGRVIKQANGELYTDSYTDVDRASIWESTDNGATGNWNAESENEWNTLILPLHTDSDGGGANKDNFSHPAWAPDYVPDWASHTNEELGLTGNGRFFWCAETRGDSIRNRIARGNAGSSNLGGDITSRIGFVYGTRLVLELVQE